MSAWTEHGETAAGNSYTAEGWCPSELFCIGEGIARDQDPEWDEFDVSESMPWYQPQQEYAYVWCDKCGQALLPWLEAIDPHVDSGCQPYVNCLIHSLSYTSVYTGPTRSNGNGISSAGDKFFWEAKAGEHGIDTVIDKLIYAPNTDDSAEIPILCGEGREYPDFNDITKSLAAWRKQKGD